jgi:hypothetical protein
MTNVSKFVRMAGRRAVALGGGEPEAQKDAVDTEGRGRDAGASRA